MRLNLLFIDKLARDLRKRQTKAEKILWQHSRNRKLNSKTHLHQKEYDNQRNLLVKERGYTVLRIINEELENIEKVKLQISEMIKANSPPAPLFDANSPHAPLLQR